MITALVLAADHWNGHHVWFPFVPLLFLTLWIVVIVAIVRRRRHGWRQTGESVLAERYARGEIEEDEFRTRRAVLRAKD